MLKHTRVRYRWLLTARRTAQPSPWSAVNEKKKMMNKKEEEEEKEGEEEKDERGGSRRRGGLEKQLST